MWHVSDIHNTYTIWRFAAYRASSLHRFPKTLELLVGPRSLALAPCTRGHRAGATVFDNDAASADSFPAFGWISSETWLYQLVCSIPVSWNVRIRCSKTTKDMNVQDVFGIVPIWPITNYSSWGHPHCCLYPLVQDCFLPLHRSVNAAALQLDSQQTVYVDRVVDRYTDANHFNYMYHHVSILCILCTYVYDCICMYVNIYIYTHTYIRTYVRTYVRTYIHTYVHTYIRTYVHTYVRTYLHTYIHTYLHTYI